MIHSTAHIEVTGFKAFVAHYDSYTARVAAWLATARHKMLYGWLREQVSNTGIKKIWAKKNPNLSVRVFIPYEITS